MFGCVIFILLLSSVTSSSSNFLDKIIFDTVNGTKVVNLYAFENVKFTFESSDIHSFEFMVVDGNCNIDNFEMSLSTSDDLPVLFQIINVKIGKRVILTHNKKNMQTRDYPSNMNGNMFELWAFYGNENLDFKKSPINYYLLDVEVISGWKKGESCPFLIEFPSTSLIVKDDTLKPDPSSLSIPSDYIAVDNLTSISKGISNDSKGISFSLGIVEKSKSFELLHFPGSNSPIYTLEGSSNCAIFKAKLIFNEDPNCYILIQRNDKTFNIEMSSETKDDIKIESASSIMFFFDDSYVYFKFNDPFVRVLSLELAGVGGDSKNLTQFRIETGEVGGQEECQREMKLFIGSEVKLLRSTLTTTTLPITTTTKNHFAISTNAVQDASSSPATLIIIVVVVCLVVIAVIAGVTYYCIKKRQKKKHRKSPPTVLLDPSISQHDMFLSKIEIPKNEQPPTKAPSNVIPPPVNPSQKKSNDDKVKAKPEKSLEKKKTVEEPKTAKSVRFDPNFIKNTVPASWLAAAQFYEEEPASERSLDWATIPQKGILVDNFWDLFPFIKVDAFGDVEPGGNNYIFFLVRDLTKKENKVFRKLGARLSEPVDEEAFEAIENEGEKSARSGKPDATVVRVFILSHDPPAIECIVYGKLPSFFFSILNCRHCIEDKSKFFNNKSNLSQALRELPLGHHILTQFGNGTNVKNSTQLQTIYAFKGGRQIIPLTLKYGTYMHANMLQLRVRKTSKNTTTTGDDRDRKALPPPTQPKKKKAEKTNKTQDVTATTQPSITSETQKY